VLNRNDTLDLTALNWVARTIIENPLADYIYTDEDKLSKEGNTCCDPFYKPDWSPEYFLGMMYTSQLGVYRTAILKSVGGYRSEFDGAQDYDLTLRFLGRTNNVIHIPHVLYHRCTRDQATAETHKAKTSATLSARKALTEFLNSRDEKFVIGDGPYLGQQKVQFMPRGNPLISIVIPTANESIIVNQKSERLIDSIIESIEKKTTYLNYEIVLVHNGNLLSEQINYLSNNTKIKLVHYMSESFNLSDKINLGSSKSSGEYLLLMNDDIRIISCDWIEQMVGMLQREGVGIVGPKLLYPDENIQHAGVVLLNGLPGHVYYQSPKNLDGYGCGLKITRNYLALTGACTMTPKWLFDKVGGYSKRYPINYNDIDYCLKLHRMGFRSVYLADVELYHFEGVTRENPRSVLDSEMRMFQKDWGDIYGIDPYYNPNLNQSEPYK
jgi:glycosyltransferase involved in cell wall biosynthesis